MEYIGTNNIAGSKKDFNLYNALLKTFFLFVLMQVFCYLSDGFFNTEVSLFFVHLGLMASAVVYWSQIDWRSGRFDTFGAALVFTYILFKVHAIIDLVYFGSRVEEIPDTVFIPNNPLWWLMESESLSFCGMIFLVSIWRLKVGDLIDKISFAQNKDLVDIRHAKIMYVFSFFSALFLSFFGEELGAYIQFATLIYSFGVACVYFIARDVASSVRAFLLSLALAIPLVFMSLNSGMKEAIFFPLIPSVIIFFSRFRSVSLKICASITMFVILGYSQIYVHYVRDITMQGRISIPATELIDRFVKDFDSLDLEDGIRSMSGRINMTTTRLITFAVAKNQGFVPYEIFGLIPASFVPRMFWQDKPILLPGAAHTMRVLGLDIDIFDVTTATAAGFFLELYLGGGFFVMLAGSFLFGFMLATLQVMSVKKINGLGSLGLSFSFVYMALRFDEKHVVYAFNGIVFSFIFIFAINKALNYLKK